MPRDQWRSRVKRSQSPRSGERVVLVAGLLGLAVDVGLAWRLVAVHNGAALLTLVPATAGSSLCLVRPGLRGGLLLIVALLLALSTIPGLFSGLGLLYLPSLVLPFAVSVRTDLPPS
jgi:hypothetical protein